jgi:hypothetical protein
VCIRFVGTVAEGEYGGEGLLRRRRWACDTCRRSLKGELIAWERVRFFSHTCTLGFHMEPQLSLRSISLNNASLAISLFVLPGEIDHLLRAALDVVSLKADQCSHDCKGSYHCSTFPAVAGTRLLTSPHIFTSITNMCRHTDVREKYTSRLQHVALYKRREQ